MAQNSRETSRRHDERRDNERRQVKHAFGSLEWVEEMNRYYSMWPKEDRRRVDRRSQDRRELDRRELMRVENTSSRALAKKGVGLLSDEEKQMLDALMRPK